MPHYADGTEAKIGDQVTGHLYNTDGIVAGTIVSITPDMDACNAMVQYTRVFPLDIFTPEVTAKRAQIGEKPIMAIESAEGLPAHRIKKTRNHQSDGPEMVFVVCADYCAIKELTKVGP